jgi:uncharacterized SAM-binding protein YcdF (DUF218 family)
MDTVFFIASKLVWALIKPETWLVIGLGLTALLLVAGRPRGARRAAVPTFLAALVITIIPIGDLLLRPLETRYPVNPPLEQVDGILVLGGGEDAHGTARWNQVQLNEGAERYTVALALARRFPTARLVVSGGSGALRDLGQQGGKEVIVAQMFFVEQGLSRERLLLEPHARNTAENARLSMAMANPASDETWVLVTSAFHMPRAMRSFEAAGWTGLVPFPVDFRSRGLRDGIGWELARNLDRLNGALREYVGLLTYMWTGR